jgi:hypothetical protein
MLRQAWNEYRGWAKLARNMQDATRRWNLAALVCVVIAAICGAATMLFPNGGGATNPIAATLAGAATLAAAVGAFFGREILSAGKEADWIQARATGERRLLQPWRFAPAGGHVLLQAARMVWLSQDRRRSEAIRMN